jgi:hypothetical protein
MIGRAHDEEVRVVRRESFRRLSVDPSGTFGLGHLSSIKQ